MDAARQAAIELLTRAPISLNDTTDHETVMLMFKYAINALEQEED